VVVVVVPLLLLVLLLLLDHLLRDGHEVAAVRAHVRHPSSGLPIWAGGRAAEMVGCR
jgi:hypothetical protein